MVYRSLPTPQEMAKWDKLTIEEYGIHGEILMENASRNILYVLKKYFPFMRDKKAVIFAGSGNNGGDGFALARHLINEGVKCTILHTRGLDQYKGETAYHLSLLKKLPANFFQLKNFDLSSLEQVDFVVDGLLGTGFQGSLREDYLYWVRFINSLKKSCFILSIDIPSGLNGYTGRPSPEAVKAHCTVTFEEAKLGLYMPEAREFVGDLYVCSIGIPEIIKRDHPPTTFLITSEILNQIPSLDIVAHKGKAGHLLVVGGSSGLTGAVTLAALGALRAGVGLVTVACPKPFISEIKQGWPEIMTLPLGPGKGWGEASFVELEDHLDRFDAVVLGPGIGRDEGVLEFLKVYVKNSKLPTVYDADALFGLGKDKELFKYLKNCILTPHPGEMARLVDKSIPEIQKDRINCAKGLADVVDAIVVLKGAGTVIADKKQIFLSPICCSNLAIGGSGDVLAGVIGSLLAKGISLIDSACMGVFWHGMAGELLRMKYPYRGNLAQDIAHCLPEVLIKRGELPFYGDFS